MAARTSGYNAPGSWSWPEDLPRQPTASTTSEHQSPHDEPSTSSESASPPKPERPRRNWKPRTCRICLENVQPTFNEPSEHLPGMFQGAPGATYQSEDGGRLLRPCKCKGSQAYVHEGCLQEWRHADPAYGTRNFWLCPTCGFKYRLERMQWGRWISSRGTDCSRSV